MSGLYLTSQIELLAHGIANPSAGAATEFLRTRQLFDPDWFGGETSYQFEAIYENGATSGLSLDLLWQGSIVLKNLTLPIVGTGQTNITRRRSSAFTIPYSGEDKLSLRISADPANNPVYRARLLPTQADDARTAIKVMLLNRPGATTVDYNVAGSGCMQTTSTSYKPTASEDLTDNNYAGCLYFKYVAAEWIGVQAVQFFVTHTGFPLSCYGRLYDLTANAAVAGSEMLLTNNTGDTADWKVTTLNLPISLFVDGHVYRFQGRSAPVGGEMANTFFESAGLWMILEQSLLTRTILGNNYVNVGIGDRPQCARSLPSFSGVSYCERTSYTTNYGPSEHPKLYDEGTADAGATGTFITSSDINITGTGDKMFGRSGDISAALAANHRIDSEGFAAELYATILNPFTATCACFKQYPPDIRGLEFTVLKRPEFSTIVQTGPSSYETRIAQMKNPIWHWVLSYNYLYATAGDGQYNNPLLAGRSYPDFQVLIDFWLARRGRFEEFLFDDPDDHYVGPALISSSPNLKAQLPLVSEDGTYYSPLQRSLGGEFYEDITDVKSGTFKVYANGVLKTEGVDYVAGGPGLAISGQSYAGLYLQWLITPTGPITAEFYFYFRARFAMDDQDFEKFLQSLWTVGGHSKRGRGHIDLMSVRPGPCTC